ncbi:hypothetical protein N9K60_03090 [Candidatus Poseidoniales archaeon]|nr:hypothetical protein [Candidatus Poseidoniales archaeon]
MSSGIVVRSMILSAGYVVALDDGMISWRPNFGRRTNYRMQYPASVLLGMKGPTGNCESIVIGDVRGNVIRLSLPRLELLDAYETSIAVVRSLCRVSSTSDKILVGNETGDVWLVGRDVPDECVMLFNHEDSITSIRTIDNQIIIQSGWSKFNYDWEGLILSNTNKNDIFDDKIQQRTNRRSRLLEMKSERYTHGNILDMPIIS